MIILIHAVGLGAYFPVRLTIEAAPLGTSWRKIWAPDFSWRSLNSINSNLARFLRRAWSIEEGGTPSAKYPLDNLNEGVGSSAEHDLIQLRQDRTILILSQCNTFFVHSLIDQTSLSFLQSVFSQDHVQVIPNLRFLGFLAQGEAMHTERPILLCHDFDRN